MTTNDQSLRGEFDVIVVGSGAGGGMAAYALTLAGVKVLMLEAGRHYDPLTETRMFETNEHAPLRGVGTPDKPWGYFDATVDGGWEVPGEPYTVAPGSRNSCGGARACSVAAPTTGGASRRASAPMTSSPTAAMDWGSTGRSSTRTLRPTTTRSSRSSG